MNAIKRIDVTPLMKPHYITTPEALHDPVSFVRINALQLLSWYGVLQDEGLQDECGEPDCSYSEFAQIQYERELILRGMK